jgi:hypothetical protein
MAIYINYSDYLTIELVQACLVGIWSIIQIPCKCQSNKFGIVMVEPFEIETIFSHFTMGAALILEHILVIFHIKNSEPVKTSSKPDKIVQFLVIPQLGCLVVVQQPWNHYTEDLKTRLVRYSNDPIELVAFEIRTILKLFLSGF